MNYPDSVRFLYALGNESKTVRLGLERMTAVLEALGNPHRMRPIVHVAGTNGKGSICAMIESGLRAAGLKTGLYTSPHLVEPTERIRIAGEPVSTELFTCAFDRVHRVAEDLLREGTLEDHPTYFEMVTAMAFEIFREQAIEATVLEVGLGGRLDATNVVMPELCVITPVDFDHERYLGKSLEAITREKAGILKPGVPAIFAPQRPEVADVLRRCAADRGIETVWASDWIIESVAVDARGSSFVAAGAKRIRIECPLAGEHQVANALTAAIALDRMGLSPETLAEGIRRTRWPGRLERIAAAPEIILDGAHNPAGARALAAYIQKFYGGRKVWLVYGAMRDKAVAEMSAILFPVADEVILTAPAQARAVRPEVIRDMVSHPSMRTAASLTEALELLQKTAPEDAVFISGSLFLVGEARALLVK